MARKKLDTLTEPMYYVLLSLVEERHGYGVMQYASQLTGGRVAIGAGTLYALLDLSLIHIFFRPSKMPCSSTPRSF